MKRYAVLLLSILIFICAGCSKKMDREAALIVKTMTPDQKIGQMLLVGVPGNKISDDSEKIIKNYMPGTVIFFGYNIANAAGLINFIDDLQTISVKSSGIPLFVSVDQEGGRVYRIREGVTLFPGAMAFGAAGDCDLVYEAARILGMQLRILGVNMNLAPVLDVNNNPLNPVINTRSFGSNAGAVEKLGVAYIKGLQESMCIAVGKHFPGHGDTDKDSHVTLPVIQYDINRLTEIEFPPFAGAIGAGVECIMTAHITFPKILDDGRPATLSKKFLTEILREKMKFEGIIITDDLEMDAISEMMDIGEAAVQSIEAGTDIVLISTHGESIAKVHSAVRKALEAGRITAERLESSVKKIIEMKLRYRIMGFENGRIIPADFKYSEDDMAILKNADELNRKVSRAAVYFYRGEGNGLILLKNKDYCKILISDNDILRDEVGRFANSRIFNDEKSFLIFIKSAQGKKFLKSRDTKGAVLYYNVDKIDTLLADSVETGAKDAGMKIIFLSTGNPFPLGGLRRIPSTLMTFSNSKESITQLAACLNGEFSPRKKININFGFDRNSK